MDSKQKVKLAMYNAVLSFCHKNMSFINSIPALLAAHNSFAATVTLIRSTTQKKVEVLTGITKGKIRARKALARDAATIAAQVYAYANANGLDPLKGKVNFSVSDLTRLKDVELPAVCRNILKAATDNITALATYNVTVQALTAFALMIAAYEAMEPDPRNALSDRAMHNSLLIDLFRTADNYLKGQMDKIIAGFINKNPEFFKAYKNNRIIVDAATTSSQIKGTVTIKQSGEPLKGAKVSIEGTDLTVMTNSEGKFAFKSLELGEKTVTMSKKGYGILSFPDEVVKLGQITVVDGEMEGE